MNTFSGYTLEDINPQYLNLLATYRLIPQRLYTDGLLVCEQEDPNLAETVTLYLKVVAGKLTYFLEFHEWDTESYEPEIGQTLESFLEEYLNPPL